MINSCVSLEEDLHEKYKKSGITLKNLVKMGLESIELRQNFRQDSERMAKNIAILAKEMARLRQENLKFSAFLLEKDKKRE